MNLKLKKGIFFLYFISLGIRDEFETLIFST